MAQATRDRLCNEATEALKTIFPCLPDKDREALAGLLADMACEATREAMEEHTRDMHPWRE